MNRNVAVGLIVLLMVATASITLVSAYTTTPDQFREPWNDSDALNDYRNDSATKLFINDTGSQDGGAHLAFNADSTHDLNITTNKAGESNFTIDETKNTTIIFYTFVQAGAVNADPDSQVNLRLTDSTGDYMQFHSHSDNEPPFTSNFTADEPTPSTSTNDGEGEWLRNKAEIDWVNGTVFYDQTYREHSFTISRNFTDPRNVTVTFNNRNGFADDYRLDNVTILGLGGPEPINLDVNDFMEHGTTQKYRVTFDNGTAVTNKATVTSSNTSVIEVDEANNELQATSNITTNQEVTITASFDGATAEENVTVGNKSINNIAILPPETWPSALLGGGGDSPLGDTTGGNDVWPGAVQLQLIFLAISIGATVGWVTNGNPWGALGAAQVILIGGWAMDYAADGFIIASLFACAFLALTASDVTIGGR